MNPEGGTGGDPGRGPADPAGLLSATAAPSGSLLLDGRYRVGPMIARGGMSTVHRGTDTRLDRPVALKIMDPRLAADP